VLVLARQHSGRRLGDGHVPSLPSGRLHHRNRDG